MGATVMENAWVAVLRGVEASDAVTLNENLAATVGVPEIVPPADNFRPVGSAPPETTHVTGAVNVPPVAVNLVEYANPIVPSGAEVEMISTRTAASAG